MRGILTLAGEGTRMLPWTRGLRKEFLPLYDHGTNGAPVLKPVAHLALETLVDAGVSDVTLVVGAKDLAFVQGYFSVDADFLDRHAHHSERLQETRKFYETLRKLRLRFAVQSGARGFGDAVLQAQPFVEEHPFLLHAADALLLEPTRGVLPARMGRLLEREHLDAVLLVRPVANPTRYGVVEGVADGRFEGTRRLKVTRMEEKPAKPRSHWAATAIYAFSPRLFEALRTVERRDHPKELEVTAAIQELLAQGRPVAALILTGPAGEWRSVGSPEGFVKALRRTESRSRGSARATRPRRVRR
jgi:UTP--glucose-1-phosphate uridylyltransferase